MPTKDSPAAKGNAEYETEAEKMLKTKMDATIRSLIRGIRTYERALEWHQALHERDGKAEHKRMVAEKLRELEGKD